MRSADIPQYSAKRAAENFDTVITRRARRAKRGINQPYHAANIRENPSGRSTKAQS